jgi:tryptophan 2,3-dioxygenase
MRKMEALMGEIWVDGKPVSGKAWESFKEKKSLYEVICEWLHRTPIQGSTLGSSSDGETVSNFVESFLEKHKSLYPDHNAEAREFLKPEDKVHRGRSGLLFIESYRELPLLAWPRKLISTLIELEEAMVLWRSSHARMVERVIGRRVGTGGSSGVDYLDMTAKYRVFVDLWSVRSILIKKSALPELQNPEFYGFKGD